MANVAKAKVLTKDKFHHLLHKSIDKPLVDEIDEDEDFPTIQTHALSWAIAQVNVNTKNILVDVYLNYKNNDLTPAEHTKLINLSNTGIQHFWSRAITVDGTVFTTQVKAHNRNSNSIPVDLYIERDKTYARSMNPANFGIDASFIYNEGAFSNKRFPASAADDDFKQVSAHEFGHSVLMHAGGISLSWGHKGSTNALTQSVKSSTPGYPASGPVDLMKYYDYDKSKGMRFSALAKRTKAEEIDIKRLIWGAKLIWVK